MLLLLLGAVALQRHDGPPPLDRDERDLRAARAAIAIALRDARRNEAWQKIQPRLEQLQRDIDLEIERAAGTLLQFFESRKEGARLFAEDILSLKGYWQLIRAKVHLGTEQEYVAFLTASFEENLFRPDEVQIAFSCAMARFSARVTSLENRLLVAIRADLEYLPAQILPVMKSQDMLDRTFHRLFGALPTSVASEMEFGVARILIQEVLAEELVTWLSKRALVVLAQRLGIAVLAGSSWVALTLGILVSIVLTIPANYLLELSGHDPEGRVATTVEAALDSIRTDLLYGDWDVLDDCQALRRAEKQHADQEVRDVCRESADAIEAAGLPYGLREDLQRFTRARDTYRRGTLRQLILRGDR